MHCVTVTQKLMHTCQAIHNPSFYIMRWYKQKCVIGNIMKNSKVYCQISECSYFVIILRGHIFLVPLYEFWEGALVMVRQEAALPMSCFIVPDTTTRSAPQRHAGYK
jgi:hypothetical protein